MLKFKFSLPRLSVDSIALEITDISEIDSPRYEIVDEENGIVNKIDDEKVLEFSAKNIFGIQGDSHIYGSNKIVLSNEDGSIINTYEYFEDLTVEHASKADKTFSVRVKKKLKLDVSNIYIETRINAIKFNGSKWEMFDVSKFWLNENKVPKENKITIDKVAYGKNLRPIPFGDDVYDDYQVFYYENNSWKTLNLIGKDNMESCKSEGRLNFSSFKEYDNGRDIFVGGNDDLSLKEDEIYFTEENYIYFICYPTHYFTNPKETLAIDTEDDGSGMEYTKSTIYGKEVVKTVDYPNISFVYTTAEGGQLIKKSIEIECRREDDSQLCFNYDALSDEISKLFIDKIFSGGIERNEYGVYSRQEGDSGAFEIYRDNIMYNNEYVSFDIIYDTAVNTVQIPIGQHFETDMCHNDALNTNFVEVERANSINPIMDLEKDVYIPVIFDGNKTNGTYSHINSKYIECNNIIFNLHFREHRDTMDGEKWKCENESYWNGTKVITKDEKKVVDLRGRVYKYENNDETKIDKYDYFSYFGKVPQKSKIGDKIYGIDKDNDYNIDDSNYKKNRSERNSLKEYQSDLLSYLGFTNDDVKYQKSKLKKSFLRISFYDSDNIGNQNLLHTATIFLDGGELCAKYIKNIDTEDTYKIKFGFNDTNNKIMYSSNEIIDGKTYRNLSSENQAKCIINGELMAIIGASSIPVSDSKTIYDKCGVRVNREPMRNSAINKNKDFSDNIDELERLRCSSQIKVCDKYSSKRSSEGFYFYTYKNNDNGVFPSDIYMRVEFNHAGYGRTIPFMMPYIRKNEEKLTTGQAGYERYTQKIRLNKIKTFDDICYDWSEIDFDKDDNPVKDEDEVGYGTVRYIKYAYIKWKYRYDIHTQRHVYYLDPDVYGQGVTTDNKYGSNIILNLYEGKIR